MKITELEASPGSKPDQLEAAIHTVQAVKSSIFELSSTTFEFQNLKNCRPSQSPAVQNAKFKKTHQHCCARAAEQEPSCAYAAEQRDSEH